MSWQAVGLITMTAIAFIFTGSLTQGGLVALTGAATGMVAYILHERLWARISWGRIGDRSPSASNRSKV
ncbi:MAG: DUF2061 domain-containing protein [Hyphomicrobiales bacterium]|nr:DUF2061 domain-containing protein [Hyphomicrobiales bacterium]